MKATVNVGLGVRSYDILIGNGLLDRADDCIAPVLAGRPGLQDRPELLLPVQPDPQDPQDQRAEPARPVQLGQLGPREQQVLPARRAG